MGLRQHTDIDYIAFPCAALAWRVVPSGCTCERAIDAPDTTPDDWCQWHRIAAGIEEVE